MVSESTLGAFYCVTQCYQLKAAGASAAARIETVIGADTSTR
jgi:hypothetical protein